jgi:hypothetical protein
VGRAFTVQFMPLRPDVAKGMQGCDSRGGLVSRILHLHPISFGTPEYAKKEKMGCTYCHVKMVPDKGEMSKNLNDTGT